MLMLVDEILAVSSHTIVFKMQYFTEYVSSFNLLLFKTVGGDHDIVTAEDSEFGTEWIETEFGTIPGGPAMTKGNRRRIIRSYIFEQLFLHWIRNHEFRLKA